MRLGNRRMLEGFAPVVAALCLAFAVSAGTQVQITTTTKTGQSSAVVRVERGEVFAVEGNDLIVKMGDGSIRHFENIPESAKITVDGKELGIHDLKPGMLLQRTITTTTTPKVVTTIQTVKGKVWYVNPPLSVILTLEDGTNQSFKIPKDQKFNVDGQMVDSFSLKKGMQVTATKIVEVPMSVTTQQKAVSGTMPIPTPTAEAPLLVAEGEPTAAPPEATEAPAPVKTSPTTTVSYLRVIALGVILLLVVWFAARFLRGKSST
jgi:hypothetical protein